MTSGWRTIVSIAAALLAAGSCSVAAPRHGSGPGRGEHAASGKRKIIDLDELAVSGVALKEAPPDGQPPTRITTTTAPPPPAGLTAGAIRALVQAHQGPIRACYQMGLTRDPHLAGTVVLRFDVDPGAGIQGLTVSRSTLAARDVEQCLIQVFARIPFPRPAVRTTITYPITFRAAP